MAMAPETRERINAVRALLPETLDADLANLPAEVYADPAVRPFVDAIRAGLSGLQAPPEPESQPVPED